MGVLWLIYIGCEVVFFVCDIGFYCGYGYVVEKIKVFDVFLLIYYVECVVLLI